MGNSSSSSRKVTEQDQAILKLKAQRDKLREYQKKIVALTDLEKDVARKCLASDPPNMRSAKLALRRKKYQESLLAKTDSQLAELERLALEVEFAQVQKDVVYGLQQGAKVLKDIHREMGGIDKVEKLMGETEDEMQYQREVESMLAGVGMSRADEEEVEDELEQLRESQGVVKIPAQQETADLPNVPSGDPLTRYQIAEGQEERSLEEPMLAL